jgi:hypothetical protein
MKDKHYIKAKKKVKKIKGFYSNLSSWIIMSVFFVFINLQTSPEFLWCVFPIAGWGIGVAFNAMEVYGFPGWSKDWERKKLREEIRRLKEEDGELDEEDYLELKERFDLDGEELELREFRKLRREWDDSDFV